MATLDADLILEKAPGIIDPLTELYCKKYPALGDNIVEIAQSTGIPKFIADAKSVKEVFDLNAKNFAAKTGTEGDSLQGDGTFWGVVAAAKKIKAATEV